jgi:hypothetical protein
VPATDLTLSYGVPARPERVFAQLVEPASYVGLSPLVVEVYDADDTGYPSVERFRLGPFRYDNHIRVALTIGDNTVASDVRSPGGVRLAHRFELSEDPDSCEIVERTHLTAPFGLLPLRRVPGARRAARPASDPDQQAGALRC